MTTAQIRTMLDAYKTESRHLGSTFTGPSTRALHHEAPTLAAALDQEEA